VGVGARIGHDAPAPLRPPSAPTASDPQRRLDLHVPAFIRRQMD
jgi:hypothetical protein